MKNLRLLALLCLVVAVSCSKKSSTNKVKVAVYYEALCPDSKNFIVKQLYPAWQTMHEAFKVKLIPYGKAIHNKGADGKYTFECQHGPNECYGNKIQGCALRYKELNDEKKFDLINCLMSKRSPDAELENCGKSLNISTADIKKCADGSKGDEILASYGDKTFALKPALSFVPTIVFNEKYDQENQQESLDNFKGVLCRLADPKPKSCP